MIAAGRSTLTLLVTLSILTVPATAGNGQRRASPPETPVLPASFLSALAAYRAADLAAAMTHLTAIDETELPEITKILTRPGLTRGPAWAGMLVAGALLYTEKFLIRVEAGRFNADDPYLASARTLIRSLIQLAKDGEPGFTGRERSFARDWYLLMVALQHGHSDIGWSTGYLSEALDLFPGDAQLTLASGSNHEILSELSTGSITRVDSIGRFRGQARIDPGDELDDATRLFKAAAAAAPDLVETRLRLGRSLYRQGSLDAAAGELDAALRLPAPPQVRYLALLFRGLVDAGRERWTDADRFYAEALQLMPLAQTVVIARSEAAYSSGRAAEAAAAMQAMLQQRRREDPWWMYIQGEAWHFEARLTALRLYVQE
jgi:tetratricopeptide (TPR) repeat protein